MRKICSPRQSGRGTKRIANLNIAEIKCSFKYSLFELKENKRNRYFEMCGHKTDILSLKINKKPLKNIIQNSISNFTYLII